MQNPESLQPSEAEELNHLQNYNKQYINNEMAAETGNKLLSEFFCHRTDTPAKLPLMMHYIPKAAVNFSQHGESTCVTAEVATIF